MAGFLSGTVPSIILSVAVLVVALAVLLLIWRRAFSRVDFRVGAMHATLEAVAQKVEGIDHAVNQRPHGEPTMSDDVRVVRREIGILRSVFMELHAQNVSRLEAIEARLLEVRP